MEKHTYVVVEGIPAINGKAVPANREIDLTEREALFDLSLGRITLKPLRVSGRKPRPEPVPVGDDVSDEG